MTRPARKKKRPAPRLALKQAEYLSERAVSLEVASERGYRTVRRTVTLTEVGMPPGAPVPGLLIPVMWNKEPVLHQYRPDEPRTLDDGRRKFERPSCVGNRLDCHPRMTPSLADASVPLFITEGIVKGDALTSVGVCAVALLGVDNWVTKSDDGGDSVPVADWHDVALSGRQVVVAFDADCMTKPEVAMARQGLTVFLHDRGAVVRWLYLPQQVEGFRGKVGVDDYLAAGHDVADLWARVQPPRFAIRAKGRALPKTTSEALAALALRNDPPTLFRRGRALAEVNRSTLGMEEVDRDRLKNRLARAGDWFVTDKDGNRKPASPPDEVVKDAAVAFEEHRFPQLARVVQTPVFTGRPHFSLQTQPGYDPRTGNLYTPPPGLDVPPVAEKPTSKQAVAALADLLDYLAEFPFVSKADEAHALALLLQPFARDLIRGETPLYDVEAPTEGTGKGLLVRTVLAPAVGPVRPLTFKAREEEREKVITTAFLCSEPLLYFDNWPTDRRFDSPTVASALTSDWYTSRILGASKFVSAPNNVVWVVSGNNPTFSPEIRRRVVRIRLDAQCDDPKARPEFSKTLPGDALANRGRMIHDACTVIAYWLSIGRPGPDADVPPIGSFSAWRYVMGGILGAVDVPDFLGNLYAAGANDDNPEKALEAKVFALIGEKFGVGKKFTAPQLLEVLDAQGLADEVLPEHTKEARRATALGQWLGWKRDRTNDGHALRKVTTQVRKNYGNEWQLVDVRQEAQP